MAGTEEANSYDEYKRYLESSIGQGQIPRPPRIMSPYSIFYFQRKLQERSKGKQNKITLSKLIKDEWFSLAKSKKESYIKIYQIRKSQYNNLKEEYNFLINKSRSPNAYICYFRQKYPLLVESNIGVSYQMITKMIAADWKSLNPENKFLYEKLADNQKYKRNRTAREKQEFIEVYKQKILQFKLLLSEDKQKIVKKFGGYIKSSFKKQISRQAKNKQIKVKNQKQKKIISKCLRQKKIFKVEKNKKKKSLQYTIQKYNLRSKKIQSKLKKKQKIKDYLSKKMIQKQNQNMDKQINSNIRVKKFNNSQNKLKKTKKIYKSSRKPKRNTETKQRKIEKKNERKKGQINRGLKKLKSKSYKRLIKTSKKQLMIN